MPERVLHPDDDWRLEAHARGLVDDVHEPDGAAVGERLHLHKSLGIHRKVIGAPALETVVFFGLCGRPVGCGFGLQFSLVVTGRG